MSRLELRVPPGVVLLLVGAAMAVVARLTEFAPPAKPVRATLALSLLLAGIAVALAGVREFRRARTTVNPLHPEQAATIVTGGVYGHTRNPMYLGMALLLLAWAAWLGHPWALLGLPVFVLYLNRFQIVPEERALARLFRADYEAYAARVRRWL